MTDTETTIEYFFDLGSPYSYMASTQIPELEEATGADVEWRPFLLGGVFKETGNEAPAKVAPKARYMRKDLFRWAEYYGVDFQFPSAFPVNTLGPQRILVSLDREDGPVDDAARALFEALWVDDRDVSEDEVVVDVLDDAGFDGDRLVDEHDDPDVKEALRDVTEEAVERGAFGAPTFFVGDEMFWGNDRLHFVEEAARNR